MRHQELLDAVTDGVQRVEDLARTLGISPSTVRRGLAELEQAGKVVRTHGGAVPAPAGGELSWTQKSLRNAPAKRRIAAGAADLVQDDHVVLLDAGSTTTFIAERLAQRSGPTVVTSGLGPMTALHDAEGIELIVIGGRVRRRRGSIVGDYARGVLDRITADIAFIGADGIVPGRGINCPSPELAAMKELQMRGARTVVVVADSSKVRADEYAYWAVLPGHYVLLTDDGISAEDTQLLEADPSCELRVVETAGAPNPPAATD
ncbi:DeoR/GlpR family DNA-binding transcription regulator [Streptomonospora nanhaiensis]|uniref:DeoR/GlpR family transcriptional regulator of sugar metabolism n=1 Tax=Streptomonospora nanhaiensis TaxID=1323731 RepID=A0A853BGW5_9ACTN|nr:DeoR/GlpR family DNA-binding transcription regulator [Streptomonospora nanhaiensis]MBV2366625.1 DeoR/GlpR family DNA-binding transcription regulator [Streptomonospora nanhaiensis]MBX9391504.1 DeoR/GlpR family DNA-binding transcription regulator [Streptomonospora nanhaiensis]NYI93786.1 DeoR/GlpR family transcriptional regulator of sugar metabolism [Streptomonospora nanhaiensis]